MKIKHQQKSNTHWDKYEILMQKIFPFVIFIALWCFWAFFYKYNLFFQEQLQLFLFTTDYVIESVRTPGGLSGYLGEFFTQFYILPFAGATIIISLLLLLYHLTHKTFKVFLVKDNLSLLSLLPVIWYAAILTDDFYLLSGLIGVNIALCFGLLYMRIFDEKRRIIAGLFLIPIVYFFAGGSYLMLLMLIISFEVRNTKQPILSASGIVFHIAMGIGMPLLVKKYYLATPHLQAFISNHYYKVSVELPIPVIMLWLGIPLLAFLMPFYNKLVEKLPNWITLLMQIVVIFYLGFLGFRAFVNLSSEQIKAFNYYSRKGSWDQIIQLADKNLPRNRLSINYLNLALAKKGMLGEKMFAYVQMGNEGLFMPNNREIIMAMVGNEVYFHLGLVNVSQQFMFESMEASPDLKKTNIALKRLAETNLINGQYEVAAKYLHILKKTLFYRNWAKETETYLYNEEKINQHPEWGDIRKFRPTQDFFFSIEHIDQILLSMIYENPDHKMAFEYLMAIYLVKKDLKNFMDKLPLSRNLNYETLPTSHQEGYLYILGLQSKNPEGNNQLPISDSTKRRLHVYAGIYTSYSNAIDMLEEEFSDTYWYYFHYK